MTHAARVRQLEAILDQLKNSNKVLSEVLGKRITENQKKNLDMMIINGN